MSTASRRCMVFKCGRTSKDRHLSFHSFPKRKDIRDQWVLNIKLGQPDWSIPKYCSSKYYAICSRHFESNCFRTVKHKFDMASRNTLKPDAVPTLYMDGKSHSGAIASFSPSRSVESSAALERLAVVPVENGNLPNKVHRVEDSASGLEVTHSSALLPAESFHESVASMYLPTCSSHAFMMTHAGMDERSPRKNALASRRCMVFGCGSTSRNRNLSFHAFPKKPELREEWLKRIKVNRPNWSQNWPESNYYAVCSRHFTSDCFKTMKHNFCATSRNTLRPDAVPSLFLCSESVSESIYTCNQDYAQQQSSTSFVSQHPVVNEHGSVQESANCHDLVRHDVDDGSWVSSFPDCITELHSENGSLTQEEVDFTDASTQTIMNNEIVEPKQTRTVRVQTMITIKKSLESKETQYDLPVMTKDKATNYDYLCNQSQIISTQPLKLQSTLECFQPQSFESVNLTTSTYS